MTFVVLTTDDVRRAAECAEAMVQYNAQTGWTDRAYVRGQSRVENFTRGNLGEIAVAQWLGVRWVCRNGAYDKADVAGYHVRCRRAERAHLNVQPGDPDEGVMLLVVQHSPWIYEISGWITAAEGRAVGELADPGNIGRPAHFVSRKQLHPLKTLPRTQEVTK